MNLLLNKNRQIHQNEIKKSGLESICKELEHIKISLFKTEDNLHALRKQLDSLLIRQITIGIYFSTIFQIHHITEC